MEVASPSPWVARFAPLVRAGGTVLDVGAGGGRHTRFLRGLGYRVVAVDQDVSRLEDFSRDDEVDIVQADLESDVWPFEGKRFEGIVVTNYLHRPLFPYLIHSLALKGVLIYETFAAGNEEYGRPSNPDFLLREDELLQAFCPPLTSVAYRHGYVDVPKPSIRQRLCAIDV